MIRRKDLAVGRIVASATVALVVALVSAGCGRRELVVVGQPPAADGEGGDDEGGEGGSPGDEDEGGRGGEGPADEGGGGNGAGAGPVGGAEGGGQPGGDAQGQPGGGGGEGGEVGAPGEGGGEDPGNAPVYCAGVDACREATLAAGPDATSPITWCSHVTGPLKAKGCVGCHSDTGQKSGDWSAESYRGAMSAGARNAAKHTIDPCCGESDLLTVLSDPNESFAHFGKIGGDDLNAIREWITRHGAPKGEDCE